jgi:hypothetical protein
MSGNAVRVAGTRELVISNTPFLAADVMDKADIVILAIYHGAQHWPESFKTCRTGAALAGRLPKTSLTLVNASRQCACKNLRIPARQLPQKLPKGAISLLLRRAAENRSPWIIGKQCLCGKP